MVKDFDSDKNYKNWKEDLETGDSDAFNAVMRTFKSNQRALIMIIFEWMEELQSRVVQLEGYPERRYR